MLPICALGTAQRSATTRSPTTRWPASTPWSPRTIADFANRAPAGIVTPSATTHSSSRASASDRDVVPQRRAFHRCRHSNRDVSSPQRSSGTSLRRRHRQRRRQQVARRPDVLKSRRADEPPDRVRPARHQARIDPKHRFRRRPIVEAGEDVGLGRLHADEVKGRPSIAASSEAGDRAISVEQHAAIFLRPLVGDQRHGHCRAAAPVLICEAAQIDIGERVAVDEQDGPAARAVEQQRQGVPWAARGPQERPLPRVSNPGAAVAAVADDSRDRRRPVVQVQHQIGHLVVDQPPEDASSQGLTVDGHRRLGARAGQRPQPGSEAGGQHQRPGEGRRAQGLSNTMSVPFSPNSSRCLRNKPR